MTKKTGANKRIAERIRTRTRAEEKRLGLAQGTIPLAIREAIKKQIEAEEATKIEHNAILGIAPHPSQNKPGDFKSKVRGLLDNGDPATAAGLIVQMSTVPEKLLEDVVRMCFEVGDVRAAGLIVAWMQQTGQSVPVRFALQCISGISQLAEHEASLVVCRSLVQLCHFSFVPEGGDKNMMLRSATPVEAAQRSAYISHFIPLMISEFRAEVDAGTRGSGRFGGSAILQDVRLSALPNGGLLQGQTRMGQHMPFKKGDCVLLKIGQGFELEGEITDDFAGSFKVRIAGAPSGRPLNIPAHSTCTVIRIGYRNQIVRQLDAMRQLLELRPEGMPLSNSLRPRIACPQLCSAILSAPVNAMGGMFYSENTESLCAGPPGDGRGVPEHQAMMHVGAESGLNPSQCEAVAAALSRRLTLIQGPPGTGKTHTAVRVVGCLARMGAGPVLACSDSNTAVDNLVEACASIGLNVCRVGLPDSIRPDLMQYSLDAFESSMASPQGGKGKGKKGGYGSAQYEELFNRLKQAQVVCATCSGAGMELLKRIAFTSVLLDEAAQATEPSVLVPFLHGAMRLCLVGDHKQLPATVISREADRHGLSTSLFDRLQHTGAKLHLLKTQFRMHPGLSIYWSASFYNAEVGSGISAAERPPPGGLQWPLTGVGLLFVPCEGHEQKDGSSQINMQEASTVLQIIQMLLGAGDVQPEHIGVIAPYAAQVRVMKEHLRNAPSIEVNSVDGFQGREKEVIIVSTVRASETGTTGFLADGRRMNVTLTRAKRALIVCGHTQTLHRDKSWGPWLRWASSIGVVQGAAAADPMASAKFSLAAIEGEGSATQSEVMALAAVEAASLNTEGIPAGMQLPTLDTLDLPWPAQPQTMTQTTSMSMTQTMPTTGIAPSSMLGVAPPSMSPELEQMYGQLMMQVG